MLSTDTPELALAPEPVTKLNLSWADILGATKDVENAMRMIGYMPKAILSLGRGGVIPSRLLCEAFDCPMYYLGVSSYKGVRAEKIQIRQHLDVIAQRHLISLGPQLLVVDDLWDTGATVRLARQGFPAAAVATLYCKEVYPDEIDFTGEVLMTSDWVVFPWEN